MMKNIPKTKTAILVIVCILAAFLSRAVLSPHFSNPETYKTIIETLDKQKITVTELTVVSATTSAAVAAIPGDATSPIANQIADLSRYLFIIACAILLEKFLLTVIGYISFSIIIPIALLLLAITFIRNIDALRAICLKLIVFALIIPLIIPVSVKISNLISETHQANQLVDQALELDDGLEQIEEKTEVSSSEESNAGFISKFFSTVENVASDLRDGAKNALLQLRYGAEEALSTLFDAIAVLIITTCVIPLLVFFAAARMINLIFGLNIRISKPKKVTSFKKKAATTAIE